MYYGSSRLSQKMSMVLRILMLLTVVLAVRGQQVPNACPNPAPISNFNASKFEGVWFTQLRTVRGLNMECEQIKYQLKSPTKLHFSGFSLIRTSDLVLPVLGCAKINNNTGRLSVKVKQHHHNHTNTVLYEMRVVVVDYSKFAILWSCRDASSHLAVYTREIEPSAQLQSLVDEALKSNHLSHIPLIKTPQQNCPEYKFFIGDQRDSTGTAIRMGPMFVFRNRYTTPARRINEES